MLQPEHTRLATTMSHSGSFELSDGTALRFTEYGEGVPILLVHGWAASGAFFEALSEQLSSTCRVIAPDLRAHGRTASGEGSLSIDRLADDLAELIAALELENLVCVGWSMGAMVLWRLILRHGTDRLAGMVVEDMSPRVLNTSGWVLGMSNGLDAQSSARAVRAMRQDWHAYAEAFTPRIFARDRVHRDPELISWSRERIQTLNSEDMAQLWSSMTEQDLRADLPAIKLPTLVTFGERSDAYGPETSRYLVETLPNATAKGFAHSGHAPHLEEPEEFASAVLNFVRRVQPGVQHTE